MIIALSARKDVVVGIIAAIPVIGNYTDMVVVNQFKIINSESSSLGSITEKLNGKKKRNKESPLQRGS